jgi:hypothetical protein
MLKIRTFIGQPSNSNFTPFNEAATAEPGDGFEESHNGPAKCLTETRPEYGPRLGGLIDKSARNGRS